MEIRAMAFNVFSFGSGANRDRIPRIFSEDRGSFAGTSCVFQVAHPKIFSEQKSASIIKFSFFITGDIVGLIEK
jgi:hypothetical protein